MTTLQTEVLLTDLAFPEGPAFAPDGSLWFVELKGETLVNLKNGVTTSYRVGGIPNGIAIDPQGQLWFCDAGQNAIRQFDPATGTTKTVADAVGNDPLAKPNDLAFDALGNLVFTCPGNSRQVPKGYVCVRTLDGQVRRIADGLYFPNGLAFSADGSKLVIAETYKHRLWIGDWHPERTEWTKARIWCLVGGPTGPGGPDGLAFDEEGKLYVAVYGTGEVRVVNPAGSVIARLPVSGQNPTNCAFDPSGVLGLVITEAERGQVLRYSTPLKGILSIKEFTNHKTGRS